MSAMINASAQLPLVAIFLRRAYGMGTMAMTGGSFRKPNYAATWLSGLFGGMGIEGAVRLRFKKELAAAPTPEARTALFKRLLAEAFDKARATEVAAYLGIDAVIDPKGTRRMIVQALANHP